MKCQSKKNTETECSDDDRDMFRTEKIWGGRKKTVVECLNHAAASERRGQKVDAIRHR
jgi:hypothetical protein